MSNSTLKFNLFFSTKILTFYLKDIFFIIDNMNTNHLKEIDLISHLEILNRNIEYDQMSDYEKQKIHDFCYNFLNKNKSPLTISHPKMNNMSISDEEMIKFMIVGWFIYCLLLKEETRYKYI